MSAMSALVPVVVLGYGRVRRWPPSRRAKPSFESLDKNSDGKVSLNEAAENDALFVAFKGLDTNKDGVLSREEFAAYQRDKPPSWLSSSV